MVSGRRAGSLVKELQALEAPGGHPLKSDWRQVGARLEFDKLVTKSGQLIEVGAYLIAFHQVRNCLTQLRLQSGFNGSLEPTRSG